LEAVAEAFERDILAIAASIGHAATELEAFARGMSAVLDESHRHVRKAASAVEGATASSTSLASATEELSASIADIGSQVDREGHRSGRGADHRDPIRNKRLIRSALR